MHIIEILKDEFKNVKMKVKIRVSSKQKDMSMFVDKLVNVLRQYWTLPPETRNDPVSIELLSKVLEASGISPASLGKLASGISMPKMPEMIAKPLEAINPKTAITV